jgi:hypothetical protein
MFNVQLQVFFGYLENWLYQISMIFKYLCQEKLKVPIAFYVLLILCNKAFLLTLNGIML